VDPFLRRALGAARHYALPPTERALVKASRAAFVARVRAAAFRADATVDLQVAPDVTIGHGVRVEFAPGTTNRLVLGPQVALEDRVVIRFSGGAAELGRRCRLRRDVIVNIGGGLLTLDTDATISWGSVVHCAERVELAEMAGAAEQVTISDTNHYWTTPDEFFWHNARTKPVYIGRNTWLCPKVSVVPGARVGDHCLVTASSVVVGTVPDGSIATGVPATFRPMALPWRDAESPD
jgi:acetyltransferase-like isoleucine patch superfamily enzyme